MTMETFDFPLHTFATDYSDSSTRVKFGVGYTFASEPSAPEERIFTLKFPLLKYFLTPDNKPDLQKMPQINLYLFEAFYGRHRMWKKFRYIHPVYGEKTVRFHEPLRIPEGKKDGDGAVENIEIKLIEIP